MSAIRQNTRVVLEPYILLLNLKDCRNGSCNSGVVLGIIKQILNSVFLNIMLILKST